MKRAHQAWLAGGIVLLLAAFLLSPFFSGQTLLPSDTVKSTPLSEFGREQMFAHGHVVQWMPYLFGGMPCFGSVMVAPTYLVSVVTSWGVGSLLPVFRDPLVLHFLHLALLGAGAFAYLRRRGLSWVASGFAALTLAFSTTLFGLVGAGHTIKLWTVCWMPFALYWLDRLLEEDRLRNLAPAALVLGLMLTVRHVQMSWYFLVFAGVYTLVRLWQSRRAPGRPWLGGGLRALAWVALGLGLAAFFLLPVLDYTSMSMRAGSQANVAGGVYAAEYSFPRSDLITWWIPGARGFGGNDYWGLLEYTAFPLYLGALWLPLLVAALWKAEDRRRLWPWLLPALLLLLLGMGKHTPLFSLFVDWLPGYAKLRAHMWAIAPAQMALVFGAALGLDRLVAEAARLLAAGGRGAAARWKAPWTRWTLGLSLGALALAGLFHLAKPDPGMGIGPGDAYRHLQGAAMDEQLATYRIAYDLDQRGLFTRESMPFPPEQVAREVDRLRVARASAFRGDAARTLLLAGLAGLGLALLMAGVVPLPGVAVALGILVALDLLPMAARTFNFEPRPREGPGVSPQSALARLGSLPDKHLFRIWTDGTYGRNENVWYQLHSIEGYHGAKPAGIQRVLTEGQVGLPGGGERSLHPAWLSLLNVEWVISRTPIPWLDPVGEYPDGLLMHNPAALPRLFFPATWQAVPGEEQFERVMAGADPRQSALVDPAPPLPEGLATGQGRLVAYEPDRVEYRLTTSGPALALLSEVWLPRGWEATLNGRPAPILRADHLLRAVALPEAGDHVLVMAYRPGGWRLGIWISLGTLAGLLLARFGWHRRHPRPAPARAAAADQGS